MPALVHYFIPHKKNNYRAHFLKTSSLYALVLTILGFQFILFLLGSSFPDVIGASYSITPSDVIGQTNDQRGKNGLPPLNYNPLLTRAAELKGRDMLEKGYWAHTSPDGKEPWYFIKQAGYSYERAGENLGKDFRDSISVVNAWMNSPGHRANILNPHYKDIGISVVSGQFGGYDAVIIVQMFGEPSGGSANSIFQPQSAEAALPAVGKSITENINSDAVAKANPDSDPAGASLVKPPEAQVEIVTDQPVESKAVLDPVSLMRAIAIFVTAFLATLLAIDAYLIMKHRIDRNVHGPSGLHAIVLIVGAIIFLAMERGIIL